MPADEPATFEFLTWDSYNLFARSVRHKRRFVLSADERTFLDAVRATIRDRDVDLPKGTILYRAQQGIDWRIRTDDDGNELGEEPEGFGAARMKPLPNRALEGRANPSGICVLYLATTEKNAISEVRPWVGADISVAQFKILKHLKILDLTKGHGKSSFNVVGFDHIINRTTLDAATKEKAVWIDIDNAFSRPVSASDDAADYVPTQILTEVFREAGYDGIVYKSQFGEKGFNIALFDVEAADAINCAPYEVTAIDVAYKENGNRWYATKHLDHKNDITEI